MNWSIGMCIGHDTSLPGIEDQDQKSSTRLVLVDYWIRPIRTK